MKDSKTQEIVAIANAFSGPIIIICCIASSFFLLNPSDRTNILIGALGSGSAMWQHQSRRESTLTAAATEDGRGSGRLIEETKKDIN